MEADGRIDKFIEVFDEHFKRTPTGYGQFAKILSDLAARDRPWQKTFIYNILARAKDFKVGDEMWEALLAFEKGNILALRQCTTYSKYDVPLGAILISKPKQCAWDDCDEWFIPDHPSRKYHQKRCRLDARNKRRSSVIKHELL